MVGILHQLYLSMCPYITFWDCKCVLFNVYYISKDTELITIIKKDNLLSLTHILSSMSCGQNFKITITLMNWSLWGNIFNLSNLGGRFLISKVTRGHRKFSDKIPRKPLGCKKLLYCLTSNCIFPVCCTTSPQSYRSPAAWIWAQE